MKCSCVKAGVWCTDCYPSRFGCCTNQKPIGQASAVTAVKATSGGKKGTLVGPVDAYGSSLDNSTESLSDSQCPMSPATSYSSQLSASRSISESGNHLESNMCCFSLPSFQSLTPPVDTATAKVCEDINHAYSKIVHWRPNIFQLPPGNLSKQFVDTLAGLFQSYNDGSATEGSTITAAMVFPALVLQNQHVILKLKIYSTVYNDVLHCGMKETY